MRHRTLTLLALVLAALPAAAQDTYRHGRVFYLEPGVTVQRATEAGAEEAVVNLPFLPGDRVWTDASGRADFQFPDGTRLRLDSRSKVDYAAHDEGRGERVTLRLWSGGIYLHVRGGNERAEYEIETPGGVVETREEGVYRLDADSGEVRLTVYEGEATLDSGRRRIAVGAGERTYARRGESPERPAT
ncbi:MAG TPA: FecR family protein, partial [Vicinamibacteria bacterium]